MEASVKSQNHGSENHFNAKNEQGQELTHRTSVSANSPPLYQGTFFSKDPTISAARTLYLKMLFGGCFAIGIVIFGIFPILYGAFYKSPARNLPGWIVDFDGGPVGQAVIAGLSAPNPMSAVTWSVIPSSEFPGGVGEVSNRVVEEQTWIAVTVNPGASARLSAALASPNATYDGTRAVSIYGVEARNENAYRGMLLPTAQVGMTIVSTQFALQTSRMIANSSTLPQLMTVAPQTVVAPIGFQVFNLRPFNQPVASVVVFVGLLFVLILSFFIVMIGNVARDKSNIRRLLTYRSLATVRIVTSFVAYFILSLFDCLLALAFQLDTTMKYGKAGFMALWMLNWMGMCAMGLAMEAMLSLLGLPGVPFFMLIWIMLNVAVTTFPIEVLPILYRYGYAFPFYNISKATRTIIFSTKNRVGMCFGILIAWVAVSCVTTWVFGYLARRRDIAETRREAVTKTEG